jgi:uncharacterized protein (TIGR03089 family)
MTTSVALLARRVAGDPGSPLLTFYDDATGERVELSAVTFDNWVAKTANLLVDGLGAGPGDRALVVLPLHWQALVVVAGCWAAGLQVGIGTPIVGSEPFVEFRGESDAGAADGAASRADLALLSLRPLGLPLRNPVPGAFDFADVRTFGDRFNGRAPAASDAALDGRSHADVVSAAADTPSGSVRALYAPEGDRPLTADLVVRTYVAALAGGGSAVICRNADPDALPRRLEAERAVMA